MNMKKCEEEECKKRSSFGNLLVLIGLMVLMPVAVIPFFKEEMKYARFFVIPAAIYIIIGILIELSVKRFKCRIVMNSTLVVILAWIFGFIAGAMPFYFSGQLGFVQSLFESVSGYTTTGLSVADVSRMPEIFLFHRSFMQFCGGLGFVMFMVSFVQEKQSMNLYNAEGHTDKIMPNLKSTARAIFFLYAVCLFLGSIMYVVCGMPVFDSILHTMGALSIGGFSNKADSIGAYDSISIELVTMILMIIGTTNFAALLLLVNGKIKQFGRLSEIRLMAGLLLIFVPVTVVVFALKSGNTIPDGIRVAAFNIISALSTTGYSTATGILQQSGL